MMIVTAASDTLRALARTDDEPTGKEPAITPLPDPPQRDRLVIGVPFELMDREAAHREMDALAAEQARRAAGRWRADDA